MISYLIIINCLSFFIYLLNLWLYKYTDKNIDNLITLICFMFGSFGILFAFLIFDRNLEKEVLMSRIFLFSVSVIQFIILILILDLKVYFKFLEIFRHQYFFYSLIVLNIITFILFGLDKYRAKHQQKRIKNVTLILCSFTGGSIGAWVAMSLFRHKIQKDYYSIGIKYIMLMQVVFLVLIYII